MVDRASVIWADFNGVTRQTIITTLGGASAIRAAVQAASQASSPTSWESALTSPVGAAAAGSYQSVKMSAQLTFQTASGSVLRLTIPAPSVGVFLADKQTVNPANPLVAAIITACIGTLCDAGGSPAVSFVAGVLQPGRDDLPPIA